MQGLANQDRISAVLYSVLIMTASEGERPRVRWRVCRKRRTVPQVLYFAPRTTALPTQNPVYKTVSFRAPPSG
jgi:hypothetical protein